MSKSVRIRTTPNGDDAYLKLKVEQDFDFIEILSLRISQSEAYARFCSDYGVVVGRVIVNNGFGVPNAKVSIFIPLTDEDEEDSEINGIYPFKNIDDKDSEGIRYNLLQNETKPNDTCFTPVGTFPTKREVIDNDTILEVYDKYYKYTTTTNNSGDFMLFGVPTGSYILNVDVDLSDIGPVSQKPYDYISQGESPKRFESATKFKSDKDLDKLIQIKSFKKGVNVQPFWGDTEQCDIGISRIDFDLKERVTPSAIFMGSLFSDSDKNSINKNCRPSKDFGRLCETETGEGSVEMIRKTLDGSIERFDVEGSRVINEFGSWAYQVPMNLDYVVTDEFGNLIPSDDPNKGLPTRSRVRFRIGKDISGDEGRIRTTAKYLVPHNPEPVNGVEVDYSFDENTSDNHFRDFHWNKIYSVSNFIPRIQTNGPLADIRNMTGIKDVDDCSGVKNPFPYNRVDTDTNPLFVVLCVIINIITTIIFLINSTVVLFVNTMINALNVILKLICNVIFNFAKGVCNIIHISPAARNECKQSGCIGGDNAYTAPDTCDCNSIVSYVPCITISCGAPTQIYSPGCNCEGINNTNASIGSGDNNPDNISNSSLGCWSARTNSENPKDIKHWSGLIFSTKNCGHVGHDTIGAGLSDCLSIQLAESLNMFELDFYNDWINGTLYTYLLKYKKKKRGDTKFCDSNCDSDDSDNGCNTSWLVDTCVDCTDRFSSKKVTSSIMREGLIKAVTTKLSNGDEVENLYYSPYSNENGKKLFATELIHLGSMSDCDWQGIPKIQPFLVPTTYKRPPYIDEWLTDINGDSTTIKTACGMTSTGGNGSSGVFFDIDCLGLTLGQINGHARCDNIKRQCEWGMDIDGTQLSSDNTILTQSDCYLNNNDLIQPYANRLRDIFYQLNINDGPTKLNSWPSNGGLPLGINSGFGNGYGTNTLGVEYKEFRGVNSPDSYATSTSGPGLLGKYTQPKNSYYFYFGTEPGKSSVDLLNTRYFTPCEVTKKNDFVVSGIITHANSPLTCNGEINVTVSGGDAPYTYNWVGPNGYTNIQTSPLSGDIVGLCGGQYTLTVTDNNGGTSTIVFTVNQPSELNCNTTATASITNGGNGSLNINVFGGVPPYTYNINSDPAVVMVGSSAIVPKPAGTYIVSVTDFTGETCISPSSGVTINEPAGLSIAGLTSWTDTSCGNNNGTITLGLNNSIGGVAPYSITTTGPNGFSSTLTNMTNLASGTYTITISDSSISQQTDTDTVVIGSSSNVVLSTPIMTAPIGCNTNTPNPTGTVSITASGGVNPYIFKWYDSNGLVATGPSPTIPLSYCGSNLYCEVTDVDGCVDVSNDITIT